MQMTPESWKQVKVLFESALDLAPAQQADFLRENCPDEALRQEVAKLLDNHEQAEDFLSNPVLNPRIAIPREIPETAPGDEFTSTGSGAGASSAALRLGQALGNYRILSRLGEGGMGQVWLAEQTAPLRRQVALKLIRVGMYDDSVLQRFESERQSLASMNHPSIAKVFDAGTTPDGQPYFAMEYVPGLPITQYCNRKRLTIRERLEIFIQVCEGVQHAHQKAIMHRDLKPANILVAEVDGKATPRIIDFGLAKATAAASPAKDMLTRVGAFMGTPGYMSPEQLDPSLQDIDTRTDVYSLGVVLYELLTGFLPFETKRNQRFADKFRQLQDEDPPRPSTKVQADRKSSHSKAVERGTDPKQLVSLLRGDLDWITMKALEKDRARRYGAPSELALDLGRYLRHEPITARPASTGYQLRKYVRRHRFGVAVAAAMALLLAGFGVMQALQLRRITRERDRANRITDFMVGMFKVSDPSEARGNQITAREIINKASTDIEKGLARDPETQAKMMQVMATTYQNLGLYSRAHELAKFALEVRQKYLGPDNRSTLESTAQLGWILDREGQFADAEKLEREALAREGRSLPPDDPLTLDTMVDLAQIMEDQGNYAEEEKLTREVIRIGTPRLGPDSPQISSAVSHLGNALFFEARYAEAEVEYRHDLELSRRIRGSDDPETLSDIQNLAWVVRLQGRLAEAETLFRQALADYERVLGPMHRDTATAMDGLAGVLSNENRLPEAEKLYRQSLATWVKILGPEHPDTLVSKHNLATLLLKEDHVQEAEKLFRDIVEVEVRTEGPKSLRAVNSKSRLAQALVREGHYAEAESLAREAYEIQARTLGLQHPDTLGSLRELGRALAHMHRYSEAAKLFRDAIERQHDSKQPESLYRIWYCFASVAVAANRFDEALQYLRQAITLGFTGAEHLQSEDDFKPLRRDPRFASLVSEARKRIATSTQKTD
jgi:eukaryotic-like serine/threonine-protein kinase